MSRAYKANCVFIVPLTGNELSREHLGVGYLVSVLRREGHQCTIVPVTPGEDDGIADRVAGLKPHFVGISLVSVILARAQAMGQALRAVLGQDVHLCAGGPIATFAGDKLLERPDWHFLDSIVRGEGESIINSLVTMVLDEKPVHSIAGVAVREHPHTPFAAPIDDLDSLPWSARDTLGKDLVGILTGRGCTGRCTFCIAHQNIGTKVWRGRDPQDVVDEIASLVAGHGVDTFRIYDATYEDPGSIGKQRIGRIAELILQRALRIHYHIYAQAHSWTDDDGDLLRLLYQSGLERVAIGIEAGSDRILGLMKKRSSAADNRRAIRLFRQIPVYITAGFIMFYPYAEWQDLEDNANFLSQENLSYSLDLFVRKIGVLPGSEIEEQLAADGLLEPGYMAYFDPLAYRYADPKIGRMARMANTYFFGVDFERSIFDFKGGVYDFRNADLLLHVYISRLLRSLGDDPLVCEAIDECWCMYHEEIASLARSNEAMFEAFLAWAKTGQDAPVSVAETVDARHAEAVQRLRSIHLRLAMNLARMGKAFRMGWSPPAV